MAASSTTRRGKGGKGDGWGGEASGVGSNSKAGVAGPGRHRADVEALLKAGKDERVQALKDHLLGLALGAEREETQLSATVALLNREEGTPVARNEHSAPGGGPIAIEWVIVDPASDRSA